MKYYIKLALIASIASAAGLMQARGGHGGGGHGGGGHGGGSYHHGGSYGHGGHGIGRGVAIGAGVLGAAAVGSAIANSNSGYVYEDDDYYDDYDE